VRNLHVLEKSGLIQALERRIEFGGIEPVAGNGMEIGSDLIGTDVPIAGNCNKGIVWSGRRGQTANDDHETRGDNGSYPTTTHDDNPDQSGMDLTRSARRKRDGLCRNVRNCWGARYKIDAISPLRLAAETAARNAAAGFLDFVSRLGVNQFCNQDT
jgi:hypothetical protein